MNNGSVLVRNRRFIKPCARGNNSFENHHSFPVKEKLDKEEVKYFIELEPVQEPEGESEVIRKTIIEDISGLNDSDDQSFVTEDSEDYEEPIIIVNNDSDSDMESKVVKKEYVTSSGRVSKPPLKLNQYDY